jgi:hypothetical protein
LLFFSGLLVLFNQARQSRHAHWERKMRVLVDAVLHPSDQPECLAIHIPDWDLWLEELNRTMTLIVVNGIAKADPAIQLEIWLDHGGVEDRDTVSKVVARIPWDNAHQYWDITHLFTNDHLSDIEDKIEYAFAFEGGVANACR